MKAGLGKVQLGNWEICLLLNILQSFENFCWLKKRVPAINFPRPTGVRRAGNFPILPAARGETKFQNKKPLTWKGITNTIKCKLELNCKTLPATAGAAGIGVTEVKTFAIQPIGEIEGCIYEV